MVLLHPVGLGGGRVDHRVAQAVGLARTLTHQSNGVQTGELRDLPGMHDVGGIAGGGDADQRIPGAAIGTGELGIDQRGIDIVVEGADDGALARQRDGADAVLQACGPVRQRRIGAFEEEALHQLAHDVLAVRGAAAVAAGQDQPVGPGGLGEER